MRGLITRAMGALVMTVKARWMAHSLPSLRRGRTVASPNGRRRRSGVPAARRAARKRRNRSRRHG